MTDTNAATQTAKSPIPGVKVLLQGESGSGKTTSLLTLRSSAITPFIIMTEPSVSTLGKTACLNLHYKYIAPVASSFEDMIALAERINQLSFEMLTKSTDPNRARHKQFVELLRTLHDFTCDRCGKSFGDVTQWGTDRVLCLDTLSGVNPMAMALVSGDKPVKSQADWQVAQGLILNLIQQLCTNTRCHFILTAHEERETDEITGAVKVMASTLGKKLAPQIPKFFDEVIESRRDGDKFVWSTITANTVLKARLAPFGAQIAPSFVGLIDAWKAQGGLIE